MAANPLTPWQLYTQLYQQQLASLKATESKAQLYQFSQQLTASRLALIEQPVSVLKYKPALTPALVRIEILYICCLNYQWPIAITSLLLSSSFCSSLHADVLAQADHSVAKLTKYPALACAKNQAQNLPHNILAILSHCYATQRRLAYSRQLSLSNLLTLAEQLTASKSAAVTATEASAVTFDSLSQQMALLIMHSGCELELKLLTVLAKNISQPVAPSALVSTTISLLSNDSMVAQLPLDDYAQLESYIIQHPVMATHVMQRASQLNRQRQHISQVKLAISLLGINALPLLLARAEVQQQLADLNLPNHTLLQQFTQCFASALLLLLPGELTEDKAQLIALCLSAPLWLSPHNYLQPIVNIIRLSPAQSHLNLPLTTLMADDKYLSHVQLLLNRYQLGDWQHAATELITYLQRKPTKLSYLSLGLLTAWQGAKTTMASAPSAQANASAPLQQLLLRLQQQAAANFSYQADELCQLIASKTHCYCPLQLDL